MDVVKPGLVKALHGGIRELLQRAVLRELSSDLTSMLSMHMLYITYV